jgi:hypothetical protein
MRRLQIVGGGICRKIVTKHHRRIAVDGDLGKGATFSWDSDGLSIRGQPLSRIDVVESSGAVVVGSSVWQHVESEPPGELVVKSQREISGGASTGCVKSAVVSAGLVIVDHQGNESGRRRS